MLDLSRIGECFYICYRRQVRVLDPIMASRSLLFVQLFRRLLEVSLRVMLWEPICLHLVPVPPTLTRAHSGEKPLSNGSNNEAHAATTSSLVLKELLEKG
jgi:hypothetical protein